MDKRYFTADDRNDTNYWVVATDLDHAKQVLRDVGLKFGDPSVKLDEAVRLGDLTFAEVTAERAAQIKCDLTEDGRDKDVPLSDLAIGEWVASEY